MSVARLLLSGLLVASGLILGAFTLHAWFAPEWEVQAFPVPRPPQPIDALAGSDRGPAGAVPNNWAPRLIKSEPKPPAVPDAEAAKAKKRQADKKLAERRQKTDEPQQEEQTVFSWLAGLLKK